MALIDDIKTSLQISTTTFDTELSGLLAGGVTDLNIAGVEGDTVTTASTDPIVQRVLISYVAYQFELLHGSIDRSNALKASYDEQKAQLSMHTDYTVWGPDENE